MTILKGRFDTIGDRQKAFEARDSKDQFIPGLPVVARLDGRAFKTFTRGLNKPFDSRFSECMIETTKYLVSEFHPNIAYTQSDEISLIFLPKSNITQAAPFDGRKDKLKSSIATAATAKFNRMVGLMLPQKTDSLPTFDARAYNTPDAILAAESLEWREMDATKNSITRASQVAFGHKKNQNKNSLEKLAMLMEVGIDWNAYPDHFKRGVYFRRVTEEKMLDAETLKNIPEKHRPTGPVLRSSIKLVSMPQLTTVANVANVLFHNADPVFRPSRVDE